VQRPDPTDVRLIEDLPALSPRLYKADVMQHAEVLGDRRLREAQGGDDVEHSR
jgi:hypothetical protein